MKLFSTPARPTALRLLLLTGAAPAALLVSAPANAQTAAPASEPVTGTARPASPSRAAAEQPAAAAPAAADDSGEILVTARRREERLQDVPLSVTVASGDDLREHQITTAMDLGRLAPSLSVTPSPRGGNTPYFVIRGQRLIDTSMVLDPVTIVYVNDVPFMRPQGLNGALFDIQNVQVLRGPQGTLFGRNTTGGAVLINTHPAESTFGGYGMATLGDYNRVSLEGALNIPLGDTLAVRFAAAASTQQGYMRDRYTGYRTNDVNYDAERITLRWQPSADFTSIIYANRFDSSNHGSASQIYAVEPAASVNAVIATLRNEIALNLAHPYQFSSDMRQTETARTYDVTNVSTYNISPSILLKNIIGYRSIRTHSLFDLDGAQVFIQQLYGDTTQKQFSEELQLQGTSASFDWIIGGFYFREHGTDVARSIQGASPTIIRPSGVYPRNTSLSGFVSGTYRFPIEGLSLSAGTRFTHDRRYADGIQAQVSTVTGQILVCGFRNAAGVLIQPPCLTPENASFSEPSWSVSLNYKVTPDLLLYVAHRRGYRSGGVQSRATTAAANVPFQPERVNDVEIGEKFSFRSGDLHGRLNLDAYYANFSDLQRQISFVSPVSGTLVSGIFNAASSRVSGVEGEMSLNFRGLELNGSVGYVHARYRSFLNAGVDISSWPFSYVPTWTANGEVAYSVPLHGDLGRVRLSLSARYQSSIIDSDTPQPDAVIPGYTVADARIDWNNIAGSNFSLAVFSTNIFKEVYYTYGTNLTASLGLATWQVGAPRMFGVQGRYTF